MSSDVSRPANFEARVRAYARELELSVQKCRSRNPQDPGFGKLRVVDPSRNRVIFGGHPFDYSATLEEIDAYLRE